MPNKLEFKGEMILISVHLPAGLLTKLDKMVKKGIFPSRSEAIRYAVTQLVLNFKEED